MMLKRLKSLAILAALLFPFVAQAQTSNTASFAGLDDATEGSWRGMYGADGYSIAGDSQSIPSYASFSVQNQSNYTWAGSTTDQRALQTGSGSGRIAATWYSSTGFSLSIHFTDGNSHEVAIYALDWDKQGRSESVQVLDGVTSAVLDSRTMQSFGNGVYFVWNVTGQVIINVAELSGANCVISGVFFDAAMRPTIAGVSPAAGSIGTSVTITGTNFSSIPTSNTVKFGGTAAAVTGSSSTQIATSVPSGATTGPLEVSVGGVSNLPQRFTVLPPGWPQGWLDQDVGSVAVAGSAGFASGVFTVAGSGNAINGAADGFNFVYQSWTGDGSIVARMASTNNIYAQVGVMIRATLDANATEASAANQANGNYLFYRASAGGNTSDQQNTGYAPVKPWVKVVRAGSVFTGYSSTDGENWIQIGSSETISMGTSVYIGLAVSANSNSTATTATFDNVSVSSSASPAPEITSLSETTGPVGTQVIIYGSRFGATQGNSVALLSGTALTVSSWTSTSITGAIPAGAISGPLVISVAPTMNASNAVRFDVTSQPLPAGWLDQDVGAVAVIGSATFGSGVFTVAGSGNFVGGTSDGFHFVYQPWTGDGTIVARMLSTSSIYAQAGLMVRGSMDASSACAFMAEVANADTLYERSNPGTSALTDNSSVVGPWLKLVRNGSLFTGYASSDGLNWVQIGWSQTVNLGASVYIGLAVSANSNSTATTVTFDNVSVSSAALPAPVIIGLSATTGSAGSQVIISGSGFGSSQGSSVALLSDTALTITAWTGTSITATVPTGAVSGSIVISVAPSMNDSNPVQFTVTSSPLPDGWLNQDIGTVNSAGSATYSGGVFTLSSTSIGLGGVSDGFHFVFQPLTSDGTIVARVVGIQTTNATQEQAGVMIRETLDASSPYLFPFAYPSSVSMDYRTLVGGPPNMVSFGSVILPYWVKAVRAANTFSGYVSSDGATWTPIGTTQTISTAQLVYVGLGFDSGSNSWPATATFDNVSITTTGSSLPNPVITGLTPGVGAPLSSLTINGSGFGASQGSGSTAGSVSLNGVQASVTSWSDAQIVVAVPSGASTGPVTVSAGNITAQGPVFTVRFNAQLTDSLGNQSTYTSQVYGGQWSMTSLQGSGCSSCSARGNTANQYDTNGNLLWTIAPLGNSTAFTYDASNDVLSRAAPLNASTTATTTYTYNSFGEVLMATDALGHTTTDTYDTRGNLLTVTSPAPNGSTGASVTQFAYNSNGELTQITDPLSSVTTITYTSAGLVSTITDAQSNVTTYQYDAHGNRTSVTDALSHQTTFAYDAGDRLTTITYPDSTTTTFTYDTRGRRTSVTDQNGKTTSYAYDTADRLTSVTDAATNVTHYSYDTENNLLSITDANGHETAFAYDAYGRVTQTNFPSAQIETYAYDANNNLTSKTDRKGQTITYLYDALNRLTQRQYPDASQIEYTYDLVGKVLSVNDPTGTYAFAYDNMGRIIGTTTSYAFLTSRSFAGTYTYDAASNRTGFTDPESGSTTYVYDTLNRLTTLTPPSAFTSGSFGFGYDALSRRTQLTRPNSVTTAYSYDNLSRLTSVLHQLSANTIDGAGYTLDNSGNRTAKLDHLANVTSNYGYDAIYELTGVTQGTTTTESYSYDPVGNRTASLGVSSYTTSTSNEMTANSNASYTYDANGNTLSKLVGSDTTSFAWDFENRLSTVTLPGSGGTVTFKYDPLGKRIYKSSSAGTSIYAYDGENLIEETNSSGAAVARYSQTQNIDEPLAVLRGGSTSYYHEDALGSVTSLSNATGALAQTYTFDSFGKQTASSGSITNPFQYTAREFDPETSLYYYRARYYDPNTGRFLNEDPTGFRGGINLYGCVGNDPINKTDPDGTGYVDCLRALANLARATANLEKDLRQIPPGSCPNAGHLKELEGRKRDLQEALDLVITHCGKYAGAAAAIAAATRALIAVLPYLEFAAEAAAAAA